MLITCFVESDRLLISPVLSVICVDRIAELVSALFVVDISFGGDEICL